MYVNKNFNFKVKNRGFFIFILLIFLCFIKIYPIENMRLLMQNIFYTILFI